MGLTASFPPPPPGARHPPALQTQGSAVCVRLVAVSMCAVIAPSASAPSACAVSCARLVCARLTSPSASPVVAVCVRPSRAPSRRRLVCPSASAPSLVAVCVTPVSSPSASPIVAPSHRARLPASARLVPSICAIADAPSCVCARPACAVCARLRSPSASRRPLWQNLRRPSSPSSPSRRRLVAVCDRRLVAVSCARLVAPVCEMRHLVRLRLLPSASRTRLRLCRLRRPSASPSACAVCVASAMLPSTAAPILRRRHLLRRLRLAVSSPVSSLRV